MTSKHNHETHKRLLSTKQDHEKQVKTHVKTQSEAQWIVASRRKNLIRGFRSWLVFGGKFTSLSNRSSQSMAFQTPCVVMSKCLPEIFSGPTEIFEKAFLNNVSFISSRLSFLGLFLHDDQSLPPGWSGYCCSVPCRLRCVWRFLRFLSCDMLLLGEENLALACTSNRWAAARTEIILHLKSNDKLLLGEK